MLNSFLGAACAGAPFIKNAVATRAAKKRANGAMNQSSLSVRFIADRGLARHRRQSWRSRPPGLLSRRALEHAPLKRQLSDLTLRKRLRSRNPSHPTLPRTGAMSVPNGFPGCFGSRAGSTAQLIGSVHKSRAIEAALAVRRYFSTAGRRESLSLMRRNDGGHRSEDARFKLAPLSC